MRQWIGRRIGRRTVVLGVVALTVIGGTAAAPVLLRSTGRHMATEPRLQRADIAAVTPESGVAGELEALELLESATVSRIVVLAAAKDRLDREMERRGLNLDALQLQRLRDLGAPMDRTTLVRAGEGGTQGVAMTLADWPADAPSGRMLVITGAAHARRVSRVIRRYWRGPEDPPAVRISRFDTFEAERWWQERRSLRQGLVEIQKLVLDYVRHPLN